MASPFAIFRKNQKAMYALLAVLCMIGFSIGGFLSDSDPMQRTEDPVVATAYGKSIHSRELFQRRRSKQVAIAFVDRCQAAAFGLPPDVDEATINQLLPYMGVPGTLLFGQPTEDENAVDTWLLAERARQMGLIVSDEAINNFLKELTHDKVKPEVFSSIAKLLQIGQPQLFDALRAELMALRLREMALGRPQTTPAQRWDYYRRQKQQATVEVAAVPVEDFISEISDATTEELQAFFDAHKDQEPDPDSPTPGFKVPTRADFQVVVAKFSDFYDEQAVTDDEIKKHYEDFKDTRYLWEQYYLEGDEEAAESPDEAEKPADKPADDEAAKGDSATDKDPEKPAQKTDDADAAPADDKDNEGAKADEKSQSSLLQPAADFLRSLAVAVGRQNSHELRYAILAGLLAADDDSAEQGSDDATDESGAIKKPSDKPADDAGKPSDAVTTEPKKSATDKSAAKKAKPNKTPATHPPITDEFILHRDIQKWPHPKHAPLWKVEDVIRKELAREKANKRIDEALSAVHEKMRRYARRLSADETEEKMPGLDKLAKAQGLTSVETGLLTARELREKFPDLAEAKGDRPFIQIAYAGMAKFQSTIVQDIESNRYLVWKVDEKDAYVPDFADVRSKVLRVWKLIKARDLAMKKAKELAAEANKAQKPLKEIFAGREGLTVRETPPFSWLTRGSANVDNRSPLSISEVEGVESAGPDFMRETFSLSVGSTGEAMNRPQTIAYVVRLVSLDPPPERLRNTFLADPFALYNEAARDDIVQVQRAWMKGIETEAKLTWKEKVTTRDE